MPHYFPATTLEQFLPTDWVAADGVQPKHAKRIMQSTKAKFECNSCKRTWSSMKGSIEFFLWKEKGKVHISVKTFNMVTDTQNLLIFDLFLSTDNTMKCRVYHQACNRCNIMRSAKPYEQEFQSLIEHVIDIYFNRAPRHVRRKYCYFYIYITK